MQIHPIIESNLELDLLEHIHANKAPVHQRDLATIISKSLGMTNSILKRLTEKGLLTISKVNNRNISYAVTPAGMRELATRSYRYVKRTIRNVVDFKDAIEAEVIAYKNSSPSHTQGVILYGKSDVDFIIEHLAGRLGLPYLKIDEIDKDISELGKGKLLFISESFEGYFSVNLKGVNIESGGVVVKITSLIFGMYK